MNIITIDGHSGSGKGTLAKKVANQLNWHLLDSGALYRIVAFIADSFGLTDTDAICRLINRVDIKFDGDAIFLSNLDLPSIENSNINPLIRNETVGKKASQVAQNLSIRQALLDLQRNSYKSPGLVADGRDMGTVVFPNARLKVFLTASIEERANRRHQQLTNQGETSNIAALIEQLKLRDETDSKRTHSPLVPATDAIVIDSSKLDIDEVFNFVWQQVTQSLSI